MWKNAPHCSSQAAKHLGPASWWIKQDQWIREHHCAHGPFPQSCEFSGEGNKKLIQSLPSEINDGARDKIISETSDNLSHCNVVYNHDSMIVNNNEGIINNDINYDVSCVESGIPRVVTIDISQTNLSKDPYAKFRFPKVDPELCEAGKIEVSTLDSLGYLINLFCHRLDPDLKEIWDTIAGRDISTPEISSCGMLTTIYDIRKHCGDFKKARDKEDYVRNLNDKFSQGNVDLFTSELFKNVPRFYPLKRCAI